MAFKTLVWNSNPLATTRTDLIVTRFRMAFAPHNVVVTNVHPSHQSLSGFKCVLLLFPRSPGADPEADWRQQAASTDAFLTQLNAVAASRVRVVPVTYQPGDLEWIAQWHPAFLHLSKRQAAILNDDGFDNQLRLLVQDVERFAHDTQFRRSLPYSLAVVFAIACLSYLTVFFASYSAADIPLDMINDTSFKLDGTALTEDELIIALNRKTYWRKNDPKLVLHVVDTVGYGAISAFTARLRMSGYKNVSVAFGALPSRK